MLKMHMRTHEARPIKQPKCTVCHGVFSSKALLYRHRQTHFEQKTHQCNVCEKLFYSAYALRSHMARHRGERPHSCSICLKSFYNPTDLKVSISLNKFSSRNEDLKNQNRIQVSLGLGTFDCLICILGIRYIFA